MPTNVIKSYFLFAFLSVFTCTFCKEKRKNIPKHVVDNVRKDSVKTYPIKGFAEFNNDRTYSEVINYLEEKHINHILEVDLNTNKFYKEDAFPGVLSMYINCPAAKFIWLPVFEVAGIRLKNVSICFFNDRIVLFTACERQGTNRGRSINIGTLQDFYQKKYGEASEHTVNEYPFDYNTKKYVNNMFTYKNIDDSISVRFWIQSEQYISDSTFTEQIKDEFSVFFKVILP